VQLPGAATFRSCRCCVGRRSRHAAMARQAALGPAARPPRLGVSFCPGLLGR
jgi:hypothetical protein